MNAHLSLKTLVWGAIALFLVGCLGPAPLVVYEDQRISVRVVFDPQFGSKYTHPYNISPAAMAHILLGVRVRALDVAGGFGLFGDKVGAQAFTTEEAVLLSAYLSSALAKASPSDVVTFYQASPDMKHGKVVTSGGLFVRNDHLYVIVANYRSCPSGGQDYTSAMELDPRADPLLPMVRHRFAVGFTPSEAVVSHKVLNLEDEDIRYPDPSKLLILDLNRINASFAR